MDVMSTTTSEAYEQRNALFIERKRSLEGYLTKMEKCYREFEQKMNEILQKMQIYKETQLGQLNQRKEYARSVLEDSVREVETSLVQDYPVLQREFSSFMLGIQDKIPFFFDFSLETNSIYGHIETILTCFWETPQENPTSPSDYFHVQSSAIRGMRPAVLQDYLAGSGSDVTVCEVCRIQFEGQGMYCSAQCAQRTVAQDVRSVPAQKRQKKCCFCPRPVLSPLIVPPHLSMFQSFANEVCSVKCLEQYQRLAEDEAPCLGCQQTHPITDPKAPEFPCHHKFHSKDCLFQLLEILSDKFSIDIKSIECPKCGGRCGLKDVMEYFPGYEYGDRKRKSLKSTCTVCSNPTVTRVLGCGHMVCVDHSQEEGVYCAYCRRYQVFP